MRDQRPLQPRRQRDGHGLVPTGGVERRAAVHAPAGAVAHLQPDERGGDLFAERQDDGPRRVRERPALLWIGAEELRVAQRRRGKRQRREQDRDEDREAHRLALRHPRHPLARVSRCTRPVVPDGPASSVVER